MQVRTVGYFQLDADCNSGNHAMYGRITISAEFSKIVVTRHCGIFTNTVLVQSHKFFSFSYSYIWLFLQVKFIHIFKNKVCESKLWPGTDIMAI